MVPATRTTPWVLLVVYSFPTRTTPTASSRSAPSLCGLLTPLPPMEAWKDLAWYNTISEAMQTTRTSVCQAPWRCCFRATAAAVLFGIGYKNSHGTISLYNE